jgi:hypothetical protein
MKDKNSFVSIINNLFIMLCVSIFSVTSVQAETYIREYTYFASEADSKITSRINALDQVKVILLQEIGTHIQQQIRITKDSSGLMVATEDIEALTAGLTKVKILDEKWTGETFFIKAEIEADTEQVLKSLEDLKTQKNIELLKILEKSKENQLKLKEARKEIKNLRTQLAGSNSKTEKEKLISRYKKQIEKINPYSVSKELSCIASGFLSGNEFQELSRRQAISTPLFTAKIEPKDTTLIFHHNSNKFIANYRGQFLMTPEMELKKDLTLKGVIYDQYIDSGDDIFYQFYIPAGNHDTVLYTKLLWFSESRKIGETYIVFFECVRE